MGRGLINNSYCFVASKEFSHPCGIHSSDTSNMTYKINIKDTLFSIAKALASERA